MAVHDRRGFLWIHASNVSGRCLVGKRGGCRCMDTSDELIGLALCVCILSLPLVQTQNACSRAGYNAIHP